MAKIRPVARYALKRQKYKGCISKLLSGDCEWGDKDLKPLKDEIRKLLRVEQNEVCPYCQRIIIPERRNLNEHIEHVLDKSKAKYKKFSLTASNLILACHGCNVEKGQKDLLNSGTPAPIYLRLIDLPFIWPHPCVDDMVRCVHKAPGPVYSPIEGSGKEAEAERMIKDLKLNDTRNIESRYGRLVERRDRIMTLLGRLARINDEKSRRRMAPLILENEKVAAALN
ncbi:hypothetical protein [Falsihalocynthiibacter arcticus]|uniref:TIGR02646 family protein n=1 Tax=Falsihalocynthiibacter arcticus TaxID=1579316 RepID=A0A126UZR8_9RHOB|nr:hypothetical protein [Falsihalocynthiibacter arcticus]AML51553.1 hypothetical protein RC74_10025 [Falsihalocynthiibacter arcticus]